MPLIEPRSFPKAMNAWEYIFAEVEEQKDLVGKVYFF